MPPRAIQNGFEVWTLATADGATRASLVPELGGVVSSWVVPTPAGPRELLYRHPFFWDRREKQLRGGWPFLFPVCGRLEWEGRPDTYRLGGQPYYLPIHGFASRVPWTALDSGRDDELVIELHDSDVTRVQFPFSFVVSLRYRVEPGRLTVEFTVRNQSAEPMPWYAGFHPYFAVPPPGRGKERASFSARAEKRLLYNERLSDVTGEATAPDFPVSIVDPHVNEMLLRWDGAVGGRLSVEPGLEIRIACDSGDGLAPIPYAQLYTQPDQPFFCVEPWMAPPNSLNHPERPAWLAPRQKARGRVSAWVSTGGGL
jgi:galactose mutarotase-like enzyme